MHRIRGMAILLILSACAAVRPAAADDRTGGASRHASPGGIVADDPAVMGVWGGVMDWPDKAIHATLLNNGRVLWYRGEGANGSYSYTWDPVTNEMRTQYIGFGIFCSGNSVMPDGRVLTTGGRIGFDGTLGPRYSVIYDPVTEQWSQGPTMRRGRYYPTNVLLGDGRTLVFSGYDSTHVFNPQVESFTPGTGPGGTDEWELLPADHYIAYYPRMHLLPNGKIFHCGKDPVSETLDPATYVWQTVATTNYDQRREGTSVQIPPSLNKFMIMGGEPGTNTTEIIDLAAPTPTWTVGPPMHYGREFLNNVILPDGTILVSGGSDSLLNRILPAEIYNPATNTWTEVAAMHRDRLYHSTGLLLPDGRCLWAGADSNRTAEIYSPPYLFKGARPVISSAPTSVQYGETFRIQTPNSSSISSVVFMRPGSVTHSQNMEDRYVALSFTKPVAGALDITTPTNPNSCPPGYYMLFILDGNKIPSVAKFIHVGTTSGPAQNRAPTVFAGADQSITPPAGATLHGSVTDDGLPNPPGACTKAWSKLSGPGVVTFADNLSAQTTATFSTSGTYQLLLTASDGALSGRDTVAILVGSSTGCSTSLDRAVAISDDDAEENAAGGMFLRSTDLELVYDGGIQTVGLRFTGLDIPQGATITRAYVQFTADEKQSEVTALEIRGQAADSAATFTFGAMNLSSRPRTTAMVPWSPAPWGVLGEAGPDQQTPDLSPVFQEIVNRPGWARKSIALIITGTGHRTAMAQDAGTGAPILHIEVACAGVNQRPVVNAGPDRIVTMPTAALVDTVTDDGLPNPPGEVLETWSKVSGPGSVAFQVVNGGGLFRAARPMHDVEQSATFSLPGVYVLRLTGNDGQLSGIDDVTYTVLPPASSSLVLERTAAAGSDDAEEAGVALGNSVDLVSADLDLGQQTIGIRFTGIDIPQGSTITNAYIQFAVDEAQPDPTSVTIWGQASDSAQTFIANPKDVSLRPKTAASVAWSPVAWSVLGEAGPDQRTPDLSPVFQEIVNRQGWRQRSLAVIVKGSGHRTAYSFDGGAAGAPRLHVEYQPPDPTSNYDVIRLDRMLATPEVALTRLGAVFPNPASGPTTVRFELGQAAHVQLELYDVRGALVRTLADGMRSSGIYAESWDGRDRNGNTVPSGIYLLRFVAGSQREMRRLVFLRDTRLSSRDP